MLIRLRIRAVWSAPLLFAYGRNRFSYHMAHWIFPIKLTISCLAIYQPIWNKTLVYFFFSSDQRIFTWTQTEPTRKSIWFVVLLPTHQNWPYPKNICHSEEKICVSKPWLDSNDRQVLSVYLKLYFLQTILHRLISNIRCLSVISVLHFDPLIFFIKESLKMKMIWRWRCYPLNNIFSIINKWEKFLSLKSE